MPCVVDVSCLQKHGCVRTESLLDITKIGGMDDCSQKENSTVNAPRYSQRQSRASSQIGWSKQQSDPETQPIPSSYADAKQQSSKAIYDEIQPAFQVNSDDGNKIRSNSLATSVNALGARSRGFSERYKNSTADGNSDSPHFFLSEKEQNSLTAYRNLVRELEDNSYTEDDLPLDHLPNISASLKDAADKSSVPVLYLPSYQIGRITGNIFLEAKIDKNPSSFTLSTTQKHCKWRCIYCSTGFAPTLLPQVVIDDYQQDQQEILLLIDKFLQIRDSSNQIKLIKLYSKSKAFQHPCLFSKVLYLISESSFSPENRRLLYQLFWKAHI
uniref:Uncharacterized protein n=1 Tax=Ditylenchus dipsaci TaxID=166011 RepID=A0A915EFS7_9BILA